MPKKRAIVLLSGGVDSTTTLAIARRDGFEPYALSFDYGQRHVLELEAARRVASALGAKDHVVVRMDLRQFGGSSLTSDQPLPTGRSRDEIGHGIPSTYDPSPTGDACGVCDSCLLRLKGFAAAGVADPIRYRPTGR